MNDLSSLRCVLTPSLDPASKHWRFRLERYPVWPEVRGNATELVPSLEGRAADPRCPHCGDSPFNLVGGMRRYLDVCPVRPEIATNYEDLCECGLPLAYHGIIGVRFCVKCKGPIRFMTEQVGLPPM